MAATWETIKAYFTKMDVDHMKQVSVNWTPVLDLHDESCVLQYAKQIHNAVANQSMPIGEPAWTPEMVANFLEWWKSKDPTASPVV